MTFKQYTLIFLLLSIRISTYAQSAPDFTVTDSWGLSHSLYADYLDQDKTVVLKIFYVTCPPCNMIAPLLEPLYQEWGGGQGDVQFIELSIRQNDTNPQVNTYKSTHGTTYPAAGGQGNSVAATVPYTNGTFGQWTGTPTFVVIAPDRTLVYDVFGSNNAATIEALDEAIAATGAQGLPTAIDNPFINTSVTLLSNLVSNELILEVNDDVPSLNITMVSPAGDEITFGQYDAVKWNNIRLDVTSLPSGIWICRMGDGDHRFMASKLFVKI